MTTIPTRPSPARLCVVLGTALAAACSPRDDAPTTTTTPAPAPAVAAAPEVCTDGQWRTILDETTAALEAERRTPSGAFLETMRAWRQAPAACQPLLARLQPAAVHCNADEKAMGLQQWRAMSAAASSADLRTMIAAYDGLIAGVGPACLRALHQHVHPVVVQACSAAELEGVATEAPTVLRATLVASLTMDPNEMTQVTARISQLMRTLTPGCLGAIQQVAKNQPGSGAGADMGGVFDHGNGRYSVPGVAYCDPTSCMPL